MLATAIWTESASRFDSALAVVGLDRALGRAADAVEQAGAVEVEAAADLAHDAVGVLLPPLAPGARSPPATAAARSRPASR